jgi:ParB family chromosome partitioning protein
MRMAVKSLLKNRREQDTHEEFVPGLFEKVDIGKLKVTENPVRSSKFEIEQLARSIGEKGLLQPIVVRPKKYYFEIVAGNRRYAACKCLGWRKIPCHIVELDDRQAFEVALVENIQRKTMNPIEEAEAYKKYINGYGWGGVSDLAGKIGKSMRIFQDE